MATDKMDSAAVYGLFEEIKKILQNTPKQASTVAPQLDLPKIESLTERMEDGISTTNELTERLDEVIEEARKPLVSERKITISLVSKEAVFIFIGMVMLIAVLASALYLSTRPDYDRADNDLKYRYIKMKGEAAPERIGELEDLFEINRDNAKIRQLRKDVEHYERLVKDKIEKQTQAELNAKAAEKLNNEAETVKGKK